MAALRASRADEPSHLADARRLAAQEAARVYREGCVSLSSFPSELIPGPTVTAWSLLAKRAGADTSQSG